jgi:hypothetical protein
MKKVMIIVMVGIMVFASVACGEANKSGRPGKLMQQTAEKHCQESLLDATSK